VEHLTVKDQLGGGGGLLEVGFGLGIFHGWVSFRKARRHFGAYSTTLRRAGDVSYIILQIGEFVKIYLENFPMLW
jgi:hypothetical protein